MGNLYNKLMQVLSIKKSDCGANKPGGGGFVEGNDCAAGDTAVADVYASKAGDVTSKLDDAFVQSAEWGAGGVIAPWESEAMYFVDKGVDHDKYFQGQGVKEGIRKQVDDGWITVRKRNLKNSGTGNNGATWIVRTNKSRAALSRLREWAKSLPASELRAKLQWNVMTMGEFPRIIDKYTIADLVNGEASFRKSILLELTLK